MPGRSRAGRGGTGGHRSAGSPCQAGAWRRRAARRAVIRAATARMATAATRDRASQAMAERPRQGAASGANWMVAVAALVVSPLLRVTLACQEPLGRLL